MKYKRPMDLVQVKNPRTGGYILIDRAFGKIIEHKNTWGAYHGIPIRPVNHPESQVKDGNLDTHGL